MTEFAEVLQELIDQLAQINIVDNETKIALPTVTYQLLRLYIETIPKYNGNLHTLTVFLNNCNILITNFFRQGDDVHNSFILRAIIGKLSSRAFSLIGSRIQELKSWNEIKKLLELTFGNQKNLDRLVQDLINLNIKNK